MILLKNSLKILNKLKNSLGESLSKSSSSSLGLSLLPGDNFIPGLPGPWVVVIVISPLVAASLLSADAAETAGLFKGDDCSSLSR